MTDLLTFPEVAELLRVCVGCGTTFSPSRPGRRFCSLDCYRSREPGLDLAARFWAKVDRRGPTECWEWLGRRNAGGYGDMRVGLRGQQKARRAHLVSLELAGRPVPTGLIARHSCDNRACVNPAHLLHGTHADNARDMVERGRHWRQKRTG